MKRSPCSKFAFACRAFLTCLGLFTCGAPCKGVDLIGYVPYYRMNASYNANYLPAQLPLLDEIRYFGLTTNSSGGIVPLSGSGTYNSHLARIQTLKTAIEALPVAQRPRLNITLGGAGEDATFTTVAANSGLRTTFSQNINTLLNDTGAFSVDIDWEHPDNSPSADLNNYSLLLQRVKQEIGPSRGVYATVDPTKFIPAGALSGANAITGVSMMTYDLGWWANSAADTNRGEHSLPQYVDTSVKAWTDPVGSPNQNTYVFGSWGKNVDESILGIGLPFYAHAIGTSANPQMGATYTYSELVAGGTTTDDNYYTYLGQNFWLPGPDLVEQRVQYANDKGLQHIIIWEIGQDLHPSDPDSLLRRAYDKNQSFLAIAGDYDGNGSVGAEDYELWVSTFGATSGDLRADGSGDGTVGAEDYTFWRDRISLGELQTSGGADLVPEPTSVALMATLFFFSMFLRTTSREEFRA